MVSKQTQVPKYTDKELLDSLLLWSRMGRSVCPVCRTIRVGDPLVSQLAFTHRFGPDAYHACKG
jgi:hypothetical protein